MSLPFYASPNPQPFFRSEAPKPQTQPVAIKQEEPVKTDEPKKREVVEDKRFPGMAKRAFNDKPKEDVRQNSTETFSVDGLKVPYTMYEYFNVRMLDDTHTPKLVEIYSYLKGGKERISDGELSERLSKIERKLGEPRIGENQINRVARYIKLHSRMQDLDRQRKAIERA